MDVHPADVAVVRDRGVRRGDVPPAHRGEGPRGSPSRCRSDVPRDAGLRPAPAAAGAAQPAVERGQVHRVRRGHAGHPRERRGALHHPGADGRRRRAGLRGHRHRHRHPARAAAHDLRGLPAGGRHDQPQVRRHRARPVDQPGDRAADRRRDPRRERARARQQVHALPAAQLPRRRRGRAASRPAPTQAAVRSPAAPAQLDRVPEQVEDDDGDIVPGDRVLLVALSEPELCRAAVEVGRDHGFKVLATRVRRPRAGDRRAASSRRDGRRDGHGLARRHRAAPRPQADRQDPRHPDGRGAHVRGRRDRPRRAGWPARSTWSRCRSPRRRSTPPSSTWRRSSRAPSGGCWWSRTTAAARVPRSRRAVRGAGRGRGRDRRRPRGRRHRARPRHPVDCVLVDLALPDGGGLEVLKRIRARKQAAPHSRRGQPHAWPVRA